MNRQPNDWESPMYPAIMPIWTLYEPTPSCPWFWLWAVACTQDRADSPVAKP